MQKAVNIITLSMIRGKYRPKIEKETKASSALSGRKSIGAAIFAAASVQACNIRTYLRKVGKEDCGEPTVKIVWLAAFFVTSF